MTSFFKFCRAGFLWTVLLVSAVGVPMKVLDDNGLDRVDRLQKELSSLREGNHQLKRENQVLRTKIHAFHSDPNYVEKVARDELGMVGEDEVIYQFPSSSN